MSDGIVCGWNAVQSAIERKASRLERIWIARQRNDKRSRALESKARAAGISVERVDAEELDNHAQGIRHQGVVARIRAGEELVATAPDLAEILTTPPAGSLLLLVLDGVQDPHNLGACMRSAAAAGAQAVVVPKDNCAPLTAVARRAAAGAADIVPLITVSNLSRALRSIKDAGVWVYGASQAATQSIYDTDLTGAVALVLGGEGKGLRRLTEEHCDGLFAIPMPGAMESLNVSVATGISLFEVCRQRGAKPQ